MLGDLSGMVTELAGEIFNAPTERVYTVARSHALTGTNGTVVSSLAVAVAASAGASSLTLYGPAAAKVGGTMPSGQRLTIGATTYATTAESRATYEGRLVVTITPVLAAGAALNAVVTPLPASYTLANCCKQGVDGRMIAPELLSVVEFALIVPYSGAPDGWQPQTRDILTDGDSVRYQVHGVPFKGAGAWELLLGRG